MKLATKLLLTIVTLAATFISSARAQQTAPAPKQGVWRYVDAGTLVVARLDLTAYDRNAAEQWLAGVLQANIKDAPTVDAALKYFRNGPVLAFPDQLKQAGAKELYAVLTLSNFPNAVGMLVIPVPAGADADRILHASFPPGLKPAPAPGAHSGPLILTAGPLFATTVDDVVILSAGDPDRVRHLTPADRPDLAAALSAAGAAPLVAAASPNDDTRKVVEQMMPQLPPPASVPSTVVTRGLRFAHLAVSLPPQPKADLTIQSTDPAAAAALHDLITRLLNVARQDKVFRRDVPGADQIIDALTPKVDGDHLTVSLDPAGVDRVAGLLAAGATKARDRAMRMQSLSNLKQIGLAVVMYANEHHGAYPDDLKQIVELLGGQAAFQQIMTNPAQPDRHPGYTYVKPPTDASHTPSDTLIAYDAFDQWPGHVSALFADGHAQIISDQHEFQTLLKKAKQPAK